MVQKKTANKKGKPGRKPHIPTDETREIVVCGIIAKRTTERIAELLGISRSALNKHYKHELECAEDSFAISLANVIKKRVLSDDPRADTMRIWLAKVKLGWRENDEAGTITQEQLATIIRDTVQALSPGRQDD